MSTLTLAIERLDREAPSRSAAVLRIGLATVAWLQIGGNLHVGLARSVLDLAIVVAFYAAAFAMWIGYRARAACLATGLVEALVYHRFGDVEGGFARHQSWLLAASTACLALAPCDRSLSLDAWLARGARPERGRVAGLYLVRLQLSAVYLFGALHKLTPAFLSGERLEHIFCEHVFGSDIPSAFELLSLPLALGVTALESALAFGLWSARARRWLAPAGLAMHVGFAVFLPVQTFSALAIVLYVAFASPERVHAVFETILPERKVTLP